MVGVGVGWIIICDVLFDEVGAEYSDGEGRDQEDQDDHPVHLRQARVLRVPVTSRLEGYDGWHLGLGLTDYTFIIKNPMDLGTAFEKLRSEKYRFVEEALDDIQLVWDNCKNYNHPDTVP